jgi:ribosome recycling factor
MAEKKISYQEIIKKIKPELEKVINFLERELQGIRSSRASPTLVEGVEVECFGQKFLLKQLAAISIPEPRQILIQPWDTSYIEGIVKSLEKKSLGISLVVDKNLIRVNLPSLSQEFRQDLLGMVSQKKEQARQTVRRWREKAWGEIQEKFREGKISEDHKYRAKDELQELVDEYNEKIEEMTERKEKEISE